VNALDDELDAQLLALTPQTIATGPPYGMEKNITELRQMVSGEKQSSEFLGLRNGWNNANNREPQTEEL
jgi:hypothetical protein